MSPLRDPVYYKAWQRTKIGLVSRAYAAIKCRCRGRQISGLRYKGLPFIDREDFVAWALSNPGLEKLFQQWVSGEYQPNDIPSIDRINPKTGYLHGNMRWVTLRENRLHITRIPGKSRWALARARKKAARK